MTEPRDIAEEPIFGVDLNLVWCEVGPDCYGRHRTKALQDKIVCFDCSQVLAQALNDGADWEQGLQAVAAFRAWTPAAGDGQPT
jgi:hypothetical protein